jgi:hypothetical protein
LILLLRRKPLVANGEVHEHLSQQVNPSVGAISLVEGRLDIGDNLHTPAGLRFARSVENSERRYTPFSSFSWCRMRFSVLGQSSEIELRQPIDILCLCNVHRRWSMGVLSSPLFPTATRKRASPSLWNALELHRQAKTRFVLIRFFFSKLS